MRAPTPSGAAEIVVPSQREWLHRIDTLATRVGRIGERALQDKSQQLDWLGKRLVAASPAATLNRQRDSLRESSGRLAAAMRHQLLELGSASRSLRGDLLQQSPALAVQRSLARLASLHQRLAGSAHDALAQKEHRVALLARTLHGVSHLATLDRGYAIVLDADGKAVTDAASVRKGDAIRARLARGELLASVTRVVKE